MYLLSSDCIQIAETAEQRTGAPSRNASLFPVPCSLFPVPCSLFPVPCSLFPVPCSLFPVPYRGSVGLSLRRALRSAVITIASSAPPSSLRSRRFSSRSATAPVAMAARPATNVSLMSPTPTSHGTPPADGQPQPHPRRYPEGDAEPQQDVPDQ